MAVGGQEQKASWLETEHSAHWPHCELRHGLRHSEFMQASVLSHWESAVQPATQNLSLQIWPSRQSSLLLQSGRQVPFTQTSFSRQFSLDEEQVTAHWPPTHLNPGPHWAAALHSCTGWLQPLSGSPVSPGGHWHWYGCWHAEE